MYFELRCVATICNTSITATRPKTNEGMRALSRTILRPSLVLYRGVSPYTLYVYCHFIIYIEEFLPNRPCPMARTQLSREQQEKTSYERSIR